MEKSKTKIQNLKPKKSLGQNFLVNTGIIDKLISAAEISSNDAVIEVGPGNGILTEALAKKAGKVTAIEKDHRLIQSLAEKFKDYSNTQIIEGDILKLDIDLLFRNSKLEIRNSYKVVGNIPYYITSHLLRIIFKEWPTPKLIILMIQKEVAQRILAKPPHMNLLALSVQYYSQPSIVSYVSKGSFRPTPKVDSAIIKLVPKEKQILSEDEKKLFFELIKAGFSHKRKMLMGNLKDYLPAQKTTEILNSLGLSPKARAEELSLESWFKFTKEYLIWR